MKTIRITRQGFPNHGQHSWINYFKFILSKKYNVIIDPINPDIIIHSDLNYNEEQIDTYTKFLPSKFNSSIDKNKKFLYVSGEVADFHSIETNNNQWAIGYNKFEHDRYLRQPSCVFDVWTLFDESRLVDSPLNWLTEKRNFDTISKRNDRFCSITQASHNDFREIIFNKLCEYKIVTSSPWKQNIDPKEELNKYQWMHHDYIGRNDGLTYREKIGFFQKYKFNIAIHYTNTNYIVQEKLFHAFFSGAIPIFFGNRFILEEGFNPDSFINLHDFENNLDSFLDLIKKIDTDRNLYKQYIESPIFLNNKLPDYYSFDYTLDFLEKIVNS